MRLLIIACLLATATSAVAADKRFHPYEGLDALRSGQGGTKVTTDGVDLWTTGEPPRRYRVLGQIIDKRAGLLSGNALNSSAFAKRIRAQGGDAAILVDQERRNFGGIYQGGAYIATQEKVTRFTVIKYEAAAADPISPAPASP